MYSPESLRSVYEQIDMALMSTLVEAFYNEIVAG